jgi:CRP-like cAMP-binding protein
VKKGYVVMIWDEHNNIPVEVYEPGMFFGEFEVYKNTNRLFSCIALTDLELLVLNKKDFKKIFFRSFPKLGNIFIQEMNINFERLEYVMEMIHDQLFPENSDFEIDEKLKIIRGEKIMLSKISSKKNSLTQGMYSLS